MYINSDIPEQCLERQERSMMEEIFLESMKLASSDCLHNLNVDIQM